MIIEKPNKVAETLRKIKMTRVFVSCSNHPEDLQLVNSFKYLFRSVGFTPITIGQEIKVSSDAQVLPKIIEEIKRCDSLILIGTPRYLTSDFKKKMAEAFLDETFMAYILNKPILAFIDKDIDAGGLLPYIDHTKLTWVDFDKYNLNFNEPKTYYSIINYLTNLKNKVSFLRSKQNRENIGKIVLFCGAFGLAVFLGYHIGKSKK